MIDIIIPAYNAEKTLNRALSSLAAQTDINFKVYVIDDKSTQDLKSICNKFDNLDLYYYRNEENIGCGMSRQKGIDISKSKYFMFMDADDILLPYTIESYNRLIDEDPTIEFIHSHFYYQIPIESKVNNEKRYFSYKTINNGTVYVHGKLYNREAINKFNIRNEPEFSRWVDDGYFNIQCMELLKVNIFQAPTAIWMWTPGSATHSEHNFEVPDSETHLMAILKSSENILKYKDNIDHLDNTLKFIDKNYIDNLTDKEKNLYQQILELKKFLDERKKQNGI